MTSPSSPAGSPTAQAGDHLSQAVPVAQAKPILVFFYSPTNGRSRRVEGFLAQVLQRRHNHQTFSLRRVNYDTHPDLAERLGVKQPPTLVVVEAKHVRARLEEPNGCNQITAFLNPWLK